MGHDGPVRNGLVIGLERDLYGFRFILGQVGDAVGKNLHGH
jgi:hypothetical protein